MDEASVETAEKVQNKESVLERKIRLAEDPSSIVLAPKTREGHILVKILFGFDRGVGRLRMRAGTYIKIQDAMICFRQAEAVIFRFRELTTSLGDMSAITIANRMDHSLFNEFPSFRGNGKGVLGASIYGEDPSTKLVLAKRLTTYVILPRTNEGKEVANLIKRLDPALLQFRNVCTDFSKSEEIFVKLLGLIDDFDILTDQISSLAGTNYEHPRDLGALVKGKDNQDSGEKEKDFGSYNQGLEQKERDPGSSVQGPEQKPPKSKRPGAAP